MLRWLCCWPFSDARIEPGGITLPLREPIPLSMGATEVGFGEGFGLVLRCCGCGFGGGVCG